VKCVFIVFMGNRVVSCSACLLAYLLVILGKLDTMDLADLQTCRLTDSVGGSTIRGGAGASSAHRHGDWKSGNGDIDGAAVPYG
jgi:hypothetical protein